MREGEGQLDAVLALVAGLAELAGEPQERTGDAGADGHLGLVDHLAAAAELTRHALQDVVAELAVVHRLLGVDGREAALVHGDDRLGVVSAVQRRQTEHVARTVQIGDAVAPQAGGDDRLEHAVVHDVQAGGLAAGLVQGAVRIERTGGQRQRAGHDVRHVASIGRAKGIESVEHVRPRIDRTRVRGEDYGQRQRRGCKGALGSGRLGGIPRSTAVTTQTIAAREALCPPPFRVPDGGSHVFHTSNRGRDPRNGSEVRPARRFARHAVNSFTTVGDGHGRHGQRRRRTAMHLGAPRPASRPPSDRP